MKALVCEICLKSTNPLLEVRVIEDNYRHKRAHFCPQCLETQLRRINHSGVKKKPQDIPLDDPAHIKELCKKVFED